MKTVISIHCPNCGAPVESLIGPGESLTCAYCNTVIGVPAEVFNLVQPVTTDELKGRLPELSHLARCLRTGKTMEAIAAYRRLFRVDLENSFAAIDRLQNGQSVYIDGIYLKPDGTIEGLDQLLEDQAPHWTAEDIQELCRLVSNGQKFEAIRKLRGMFEIGIKDAKEAVENLAQAGQVTVGEITIKLTGEYSYTAAVIPPGYEGLAGTAVQRAELARLVAQGDKINAIVLFRKIYDTSLKESKTAVENMIRTYQRGH